MKFATPAIALMLASGAAAFVLPDPHVHVRSATPLASYLDDLGGASAPTPRRSPFGSYLDSIGDPTGAPSGGEAAAGYPATEATDPARVPSAGPAAPEGSADGVSYGLASGTKNTYVIPGMEEMGAEEYRAALQASVSGRQRERRRLAHESGIIGNRSSNGYLDTLSAGGSGGMWKETVPLLERTQGENGSTVERAPVDMVAEERRRVVELEERREAVVAKATVEREEQVVQREVFVSPVYPPRASGYTAPSSATLGDFLIQRAIQQQLYFHAQLGNEPMNDWLKRFRSHQHLDSSQRREGRCGFPGTYSAALGQLHTTPFTAYLEALGTEPDSSFEVSFIKPQKRLSARERANPYLNNQPPVVEVYDQPVITSKILTQLLTTADALVETWAFHFLEAERTDLERVANDRNPTKGLPSSKNREDAELVRGGETAYSRFTGDEPMPLYGFDCRACDRFDTLRALSLLVDEVTALTPETAFNVDYLRREAAWAGDDDAAGDAHVQELLLKRRKARRANFERDFVAGDDFARGGAARAAALAFLSAFCNEWVPKLAEGDPRSSVSDGEYRHAPGMKELRPADAGVDADEAFEELWEFGDEGAPRGIHGGELVLPGRMGERLREIRAAVAAESGRTLLELVAPELRKARIDYTDFVESDSDGMGTYERFAFQAKVDGSENDVYSTAAIVAEMSID